MQIQLGVLFDMVAFTFLFLINLVNDPYMMCDFFMLVMNAYFFKIFVNINLLINEALWDGITIVIDINVSLTIDSA